MDGSDESRIRSAAGANVATLSALANDAAVTVRAVLALNPAASDDVNAALSCDADERVRELLARKLARLVPTMSNSELDALQSRAYATLSALVIDEAIRVRAVIADVVKDMKDAPHDLVIRLARDAAVAVHEPVIRLSPVLTAEDLIGLLARPPSNDAVTAVAQRDGLCEHVADAIVANADARAISALLRNPAAAVREATLDALAARCAEHPDWQESMVSRPRLGSNAANLLADVVATDLLAQLAARGDLEQSVTDELRRRLAARIGPKPAAASGHTSIREAFIQAQVFRTHGGWTRPPCSPLFNVGTRDCAQRCSPWLPGSR